MIKRTLLVPELIDWVNPPQHIKDLILSFMHEDEILNTFMEVMPGLTKYQVL